MYHLIGQLYSSLWISYMPETIISCNHRGLLNCKINPAVRVDVLVEICVEVGSA